MTATQVTISIISLCLAISGWGKLIYDHIMNKPKIQGRVFPAMVGQFAMHVQPNNKTLMTGFFIYLYLINSRKSSVHVLDYEVEAIFTDGDHVKLQRGYGLEKLDKVHFSDLTGNKIEIPDLNKKLIYKKAKAVEYGTPVHGFLFMMGAADLFNKSVAGYIIIVEDALGKKHNIKVSKSEFGNLSLLSELAEFDIPETAIIEKNF